MRRVVAIVSVGGASACSLFTDLGGFSKEGEVADAMPVLDSSPNDGGIDASNDIEASASDAGSFCVPGAHAFCTDFDGADPFNGWVKDIQAPATLEIDGIRSKSKTKALHAVNPRQAPPTRRTTALNRSFSLWKRTVVDVELYVVAPAFQDGDSNAGIIAISFNSDSGTTGLQVVSLSVDKNETHFAMSSGGTYLGGPTGAPLPYDTWVHGHFDITPGGALTAKVGDIVFSTTWPTVTPGTNPETDLQLGVIGYNTPAPMFDVSVDDVTVDFP